MNNYAPSRWVECELTDLRDERPEPDFSKVPKERRELVRRRWEDSYDPQPERWHLWEPQIPLYRRSGFRVVRLDDQP